jgi:hypothetical protein
LPPGRIQATACPRWNRYNFTEGGGELDDPSNNAARLHLKTKRLGRKHDAAQMQAEKGSQNCRSDH